MNIQELESYGKIGLFILTVGGAIYGFFWKISGHDKRITAIEDVVNPKDKKMLLVTVTDCVNCQEKCKAQRETDMELLASHVVEKITAQLQPFLLRLSAIDERTDRRGHG